MKCWWNRHSNLTLEGVSKEDVEELTGCIPLLLNQCVASGKVDLSPLEKVANKAVTFTDDMKVKKIDDKTSYKWKLYVPLIQLSTMDLTF